MAETFLCVHRTVFLLAALSGCCHVIMALPPVVSNLPVDKYAGELETTERLLYIYTIADPNADAFTCTNTITGTLAGAAATPVGDEFSLRRNAVTNNYELYVTTAGATSFDVTVIDQYVNTITCTDSNGETSTGLDLNANIVGNERVTINNVEGAGNDLTVSAQATGQGVTVKTVSGTSQAGHNLRYSLTSNPSFSPEFFRIDSSTGAIITNREMQYLDSGTTTMYLTITATDDSDQIEVYATQTVHLTNQNTIPTVTNLPLAETRSESLAAGTVLFTTTLSDPDTGQTHTYRHTCIPTSGEDTFTIDNNGNFEIATGMSLDYESISFFNCSIYISDGIHEGGPFIYQLTVADDNEAPTFTNTMHYATVTEGAQGSVSFTPGFTCNDVDSGDTTTYDLNPANNSDRFAIDASGVMTFNTDYDVDNSNMPTNVILTVLCIDSGGTDGVMLTGSTQVSITINDANDNEPQFPATTYSISVNQYTQPGSVIGSIAATDADSGTNADLTCSGVSTSAYGSYYTVGNDCNIYLTRTIDFDYGTHVGFTAYAVDDGTPQLTGTTAIDIVYTETTTTTVATTTTTQYNFFAHGENIAMFVLTLLAGLALLGLLCWCLLRYCCGCGGGGGNMCDCYGNRRPTRRYPPRQVTPETPPRKRRPPSPVYREPTPPPKTRIVTLAKPIPQYPPPYVNPYRRSLPPGPITPYVRTAPTIPGFYR